ncbi:MAG TPA: Rrf2 family transcriptional regulator, partial [Candidatus Acetothermia bacterium]|nr:Rrf2 family transcriptional regulator [Candidatus Acetothermia bacterium]
MFSKAVKYTLTALIQLVTHTPQTQLRSLAATAHVPYPFLAKLVPTLVQAGILSSSRGKGGGVRLARPPAEISLLQVIQAVDGNRILTDCPFHPRPCPGNPYCPLRELWDP